MPFTESEELISAFRQGDEKALAAYFNEYYPALCSYACSYCHDMETAKEIASEAFVKTWRYREQFQQPGHIGAYMYKIVRGDAGEWNKKHQRTASRIDDAGEIADDDADDYSKIIKAETLRWLYMAIENLPAECRNIFRMLYVEEKDMKQIAAELSIAHSTVEAQKARGISLLKKRISLLVLSVSLLV